MTTDTSTRRQCTGCLELKAPEEFYRGRAKCKTCHQRTNLEAQRRRLEGRPRHRAGRPPKPRAAVAEKRCSRCGDVKERFWFHADTRNPDGLRSECVDCGASPAAHPSANPHHPSSLDHLPRVAEVPEGGTSRG